MVGQLVPASEMPIWQAHFNAEPWGFEAQDMLASKSAFQIIQASAQLKSGTDFTDFMFRDRFETGDLDAEEFESLSEEEKTLYVNRQVALAQKVLD
jgi:hypothetical protein